MRLSEFRIRAVDGVELALHRLTGAAERAPLLLVSGTFNGRAFWMRGEEEGVAWQLAREGFDVWMLDPRGHGASERPPGWLLSDWIERDAPAAVEAVLGETGAASVSWVGHSAGGVVGAAFAGTEHAAARRLGSLVMLGAPGPGAVGGRRRWFARAFYWMAAARGRGSLPGEPLRLGPEPESARLVRQWLGWNLRGAWHGPGGQDYLARAAQVTAPVLAVAGAGDELLAPLPAVRDLLERFRSAPRHLLVAGREEGMSRDYNHGGMVLARSARDDIWPRIARWLEAHAAAHPAPPEPVDRS